MHSTFCDQTHFRAENTAELYGWDDHLRTIHRDLQQGRGGGGSPSVARKGLKTKAALKSEEDEQFRHTMAGSVKLLIVLKFAADMHALDWQEYEYQKDQTLRHV
eukprot:590301-Amphidinium_carterae.2